MLADTFAGRGRENLSPILPMRRKKEREKRGSCVCENTFASWYLKLAGIKP